MTSLRDSNHHLLNLVDLPSYDEDFSSRTVDQLVRARDSLFSEICQDLGVKDFSEIRARHMIKPSVTKKKLSEWLECVCYMVDSFAAPHMQSALERIEELSSEKIEDQKTVISLQNQLIEKKDRELNAVQNTVQTELKTYSSALTKTCAAALAPKKIKAAVQSVSEKEERSRNIIIYGMSESSGENLQEKVSEVISKIDEKPVVKDSCRIGPIKSDRPRPVKFTVNSSDVVSQVLRKAKLLRTQEGYSKVYLCPDRSAAERKVHKELWDQVKQKKSSEPNRIHLIRDNKVVSFDKDSRPTSSGKT